MKIGINSDDNLPLEKNIENTTFIAPIFNNDYNL